MDPSLLPRAPLLFLPWGSVMEQLWSFLAYGKPCVYKLSVEAEHQNEVLIPEGTVFAFPRFLSTSASQGELEGEPETEVTPHRGTALPRHACFSIHHCWCAVLWSPPKAPLLFSLSALQKENCLNPRAVESLFRQVQAADQILPTEALASTILPMSEMVPLLHSIYHNIEAPLFSSSTSDIIWDDIRLPYFPSILETYFECKIGKDGNFQGRNFGSVV